MNIRSGWWGWCALTLLAFGTADARARSDDDAGAVYSLSNAVEGNELVALGRDGRGRLSPAFRVATGGSGTGGSLGNQGALAFAAQGHVLYAVNAGSDTIGVVALRPRPRLIQVVPSGGRRPVSLTVRGRIVYVLNAGGADGDVDQITGFIAGPRGRLWPLPGSTRPLSGPAVGPAQVGFSDDGKFLVVTERATNLIDTFAVDRRGYAEPASVTPSSGPTPFGFAFNRRGVLIVSEASGGGPSAVSSYELGGDGSLELVTPSAPTTQDAACWIAVTADGRFAYSTNTGSGTVTGFEVDRDGALTPLDRGVTGLIGTGSAPVDAATVGNRYLYVLDRIGGRIVAFRIEKDGALTMIQEIPPLPAGATGLLAR